MQKQKLVNYVKAREDFLPEYNIGPLQIIIKDRVQDNVDLNGVFSSIERIIPYEFLKLVDVAYIGDFEFLKNKKVNAVFMDGAIYISNEQDDSADLIDDIVHELAHAVEENYGELIYSDGEIKEEFLQKRKMLKSELKYLNYSVHMHDFSNVEYDQRFDSFLHEEIGYDALAIISANIFLAPYSITSLREYFARGFEEYYIGKHSLLKQICPYIYKKLFFLEQNEVINNEF